MTCSHQSSEVRDLQLFRDIRKGDEFALELLYNRHAPAVLGLAMRILRNRADADETLIEVFHQIWDRAARFDPDRASPVAYLMTVARSRALDHLRARNRRNWKLVAFDLEQHLDIPIATAGADSPLERALGRERHQLVREALSVLSRDQRRAVELSFFQGLTQTEIAEHLGIPLGTVKTRIRQGLIRLRDAIDSDRADEEA